MPSHILVADDDEICRGIVEHVLTKRGHAVTLAEDGLGALDLLRRRNFALVILDYHMPLLDGVGTARRAFEIEAEGARARFIGVTGDPAGLESRDEAHPVFDAIVQKPINVAALLAVVDVNLRLYNANARRHDILLQWRACGFPRRPRAIVATEERHCGDAAVEMLFDLGKPENPDLVLLTAETAPHVIETLRTAGNLFTLPAVDTTARWGDTADVGFDPDETASWCAVASRARAFAERRTHLTNRFLGASSLADQLLAYVYVSGRDLHPVRDPFGDYDLVYPGLFPAEAVMFAVQRLERQGLLRRVTRRRRAEDPPELGVASDFTLTEQAVESLTGALATEVFPRASFV